MIGIEKYNEAIQKYLDETLILKEPIQLYRPIQYIISLGGKRLRPILTLMTCDFFKTDYKRALPAALAIELFHNFSLIHDDIMDQAPMRRGMETVHHKWDLNTGILSGDAMLILAYQLFEVYNSSMFQDLAKLFSKTALQVCEGQRYDVDFETRNNVTIPDYIKMIDYKTAVLLGAAVKMGAIVAEASDKCKENSYEFGRNLGIAFQLQDDYLDAFGDSESFGKQIGGDIIANKKTFLYLVTLQNSSKRETDELIKLFSETPKDPKNKIKTVLSIYKNAGAVESTINEIEKYTNKANIILQEINISEDDKKTLGTFGKNLMNRTV
ncbi:MAG: polyprenyl synthetase family protein [Bacteroidetes bacterium]|nr:polyprenyl synthetase family protein [Bacteroidota bacterium]